MTKVTCPYCEKDAEVHEWESYDCSCGAELDWDEYCDEEYDNCWIGYYWSK